MKNEPIYVELSIDSEMDKLWNATQNPDLHQQWDLRFSEIKYLPKEEGKPQEFLYRTNIGFGKSIEGWGKSVGSHHTEDGSKTSSLHFGTDQAISIIKEGRGYWKYIPQSDHSIQFLTQYNYEPSFGLPGKLFDRFIFRPMMGWATALSFDVLKRWMETGETPASQYTRFFSNVLLSFFFSFLWIYHGIVPKLIAMHPDEVLMVTNILPLTNNEGELIVLVAGVLEVLVGITWMLYKNKRRLFCFQAIAFPILMATAIVSDIHYIFLPFNPLTFNLALLVLSIIGIRISANIPTATSCKRKP
ncbi:DoxX-like family protein [Ornithinibacillus xuwenensis]|uniref:DoxX-like family protein n=1 Tax=Ornithinibacillus xuwenensis TaxID=3144668 RepID=A0ABU9XEH4_9BACI